MVRFLVMNSFVAAIVFWGICLQKIIYCGVIERTLNNDVHHCNVHVDGNPILHNHLHLLVNTTSSLHSISLVRAQHHVMTEDVQSFLVFEDGDGKIEIHTEKVPNDILKYKNQFFHNDKSGTIVSVIPADDGGIHVEGILSQGIIIAPPGSQERHKRDLHPTKHTVWTEDDAGEFTDYLEVPEYFKHEHIANRINKLKVTKRDTDTPHLHTLHKRSSENEWEREIKEVQERINTESKIEKTLDREDEAEYEDYLEVPAYFEDESLFKNLPHNIRNKRQATNGKEQFIIEVFLLVDYKIFEWFEKDISKIGTYLLHFWQAVNYKFRTMKNPDVAIKVKQYGAVQSTKFQKFIEDNRIPGDTSLISLKEVLDGFRQWMIKFESNVYFSPHDVGVLMTGEDLCRKNKTNSECFKLTAGIGYVKGACISSRKFPYSTYDVAVSEMGKSFKGVIVSAHEVGHLIGAYHDGEGDATGCPKDSGYIMSYTRHNATMFTRFSECSNRSIKNFLVNTWYSRCLSETSKAGYAYPDMLPGQYMPILDQCFQYSNGYPCPSQPIEERCEKLCCENHFYRVYRREPAVDGTECGTDKVCMNGACIPTPTPTVPAL